MNSALERVGVLSAGDYGQVRRLTHSVRVYALISQFHILKSKIFIYTSATFRYTHAQRFHMHFCNIYPYVSRGPRPFTCSGP